jgi:hypothetical protein
MGRFYKTANANPMDYMYQLNLPLMQNVLAANEAGLNNELNQADQIGSLAEKFNYLTPDSDRAKQIMDSYNKQVDDLSRSIQTDPLSWRKKKGELKALGRKLETDYRAGEISKIAGNYARYKELDDYITKREEAGKLSPYEGQVFRQKALESLKEGTSYNPQTGQYNLLNAVKPMDTIDIRERLSKFIDNMKANEGLEWDTQAGQYFKKTTKGKEYISPERIIETAMSGLMGDNELQQYLKQRTDFGLMKGVYDKEGKFISPYNYVMNPANEIEKQQIATLQNQINQARKTNPTVADQLQQELDAKVQGLSSRTKLQANRESSLMPIIASLAGEYSYEKVKEGIDLKNNSLYNLGINLDFQGKQKALDRAQKEDFFNARQKQAEQFHKDVMELGWYKAMNPPQRGTGSKATAKAGSKTKVEETPTPTSVGAQDATPWFGDKFYTNAGLSETLDQGKKDMDSLSNKIKGYQTELINTLRGRSIDQLTPQERAQVDKLNMGLQNAQNQLQDRASTTDQARQWYNQSVDYALRSPDASKRFNISDKDRELYAQFGSDRMAQKLKEDIDRSAESQYVFPGAHKGTVGWFGRNITEDDPELLQKRQLLTDYLSAKERIDKARDFYLQKARETTNQAPTIEFGSEDKKAIGALLNNKTHGLQLFDSKGNEGAGMDLGNESATFRDGSLQKYIQSHNGEIEWLGVSPSLGFDEGKTGAVVRIRVKNKDKSKNSVGDIPSDKDLYVTLDPDSQQAIGLKYATDKNPEIASLGQKLLNARDQQIRNKFMDIRNGINPQTGEYGPAKTVQIPVPGGSVPVTVRSFYRGDGEYDYYVTLKKSDGTEVPMKSSGSTNGFFDSIDQFIQDFNQNYQNKTFD